MRELVDAALVTGPSGRRSCVDIAVAVTPERPGQIVQLQRKRRSGWRLMDRLTLGPGSEALASPCFTSDDAGVVRLRARWVAQDELNETSSSPVLGFEVSRARTNMRTAARWTDAIGNAIGDRAVSVAIGQDDVILYHHEAEVLRRPASNEKLLLAMTMCETFGADFRLRTSVAVTAGDTGNVHNLWILGRGDPTVDGPTMAALAHDLVDAGITSVQGRIVGATDYFARDWDAPGWDRDARDYVDRPTALTFEGNHHAHPSGRPPRRSPVGSMISAYTSTAGPPPPIPPTGSRRSRSNARRRSSDCSSRRFAPRTTSWPRRSASV